VGALEPPATDGWRGLHFDASGERLLATARGEAVLVGARGGEPIARLEGDPSAILEGLLLSDTRVLTVAAGLSETPLRLHDAAGLLLAELDLGAATRVQLVESREGRVVAAVSNPGAAPVSGEPAGTGDRVVTIDLEPLQIARVDENLIWRPLQGPWLPAQRDRPAGSRLLVTRMDSLEPIPRASLLLYDVETGGTDWVAGPR
jgi:hypothetical protein